MERRSLCAYVPPRAISQVSQVYKVTECSRWKSTLIATVFQLQSISELTQSFICTKSTKNTNTKLSDISNLHQEWCCYLAKGSIQLLSPNGKELRLHQHHITSSLGHVKPKNLAYSLTVFLPTHLDENFFKISSHILLIKLTAPLQNITVFVALFWCK